MSKLSICGARVITPGKDLGVTAIRIEGDRIAGIGGGPSSSHEEIDATGLIALPGFIDIHSQGRGGADFCDATDAAFEKIGRGSVWDAETGEKIADLAPSGATAVKVRLAPDRLARLLYAGERFETRQKAVR